MEENKQEDDIEKQASIAFKALTHVKEYSDRGYFITGFKKGFEVARAPEMAAQIQSLQQQNAEQAARIAELEKELKYAKDHIELLFTISR